MKCIPNDVFFAWVESEIAEGRTVRFRLKGNSMFPLLWNEAYALVDGQNWCKRTYCHQRRYSGNRVVKEVET